MLLLPKAHLIGMDQSALLQIPTPMQAVVRNCDCIMNASARIHTCKVRQHVFVFSVHHGQILLRLLLGGARGEQAEDLL